MTSWIEIVNWDRFQHYRDRRPVWIKLHLDLLDNHDYLGLPEGSRLLLIELWMLRGRMGPQITDSTATLSRQLGHRVLRAQLERLTDAGFIRLLASRPLARSEPRGREIKDLEQELKKSYGQI